ncbi:hydrogenase maturation protease [Methanobrevibacter sp.]|uniref:hydrogenase maturation protease n=1 Tax=Methanobrevibacter sp. TaxID=66852 RepID=UPI0025F242A0|nr:hydrogenase maturation protease [Methanobrevibacter sp.]
MLNNFDKISTDIDLFLENCDSLIVLGIGNDIRGDDGLGPYIINQLSILKAYVLNNSNIDDIRQEININQNENQDNEFEFFDNVIDINTGNTPLDEGIDSYIDKLNVDVNESLIERMKKTFFINGGSVPENFTGLIKKINPSHIIIIDASLMNMEAGEINIVNKDNIVDISISTHSMSLAYLIRYLELENEFNILFIGIEPESMDLSFELSDNVKESSNGLVKLLFDKILGI